MKKTTIQIKTIFGKVLFEHTADDNTIKKTLVEAVDKGVDMRGAYLSGADLRGANLSGANLRGAYLRYANLSDADMRGAYLSDANLRGANLSDADMRGANLRYADLIGANISKKTLKEIQPYFSMVPDDGDFVAWKKGMGNHLIKLKIHAKAKRVNAIGSRKCRAEFAEVLGIYDMNNKGKKVQEIGGTHNPNFFYKTGEVVYPDEYDPSPLVECSHGIHFFITKQEAKDW